RALLRQPALRPSRVTLTSLSGVGYLRHYSSKRNLLLDPDFIAVVLGEAFERPVTVELVSAPLIGDRQEVPAARDFALRGRTARAIDLGLLGVGALVPGHRFHHEGSPSPPAQHEALYNPIRESLRALLRIVQSVADPGYVPVADIAYHLFF